MKITDGRCDISKPKGTLGRSSTKPPSLEKTADWLTSRSRVVIGLEHFELVPLDQVLAGKEHGRNATLFDQSPEALRMDAEFAGGFD
jgi:hypothetical protein